MGFYSNYIFPRLIDWSLGSEVIQNQRRETLAVLRGQVLEIGFGTGLNILHYPAEVQRLTAIDTEEMLPKRLAKRIAEARFPIDRRRLDAGDRLPFDDDSFDGVVTTFTLCSIGDVGAALAEIRRVLKPSGRYVFLEHGRSEDPRVAKWQDRFNPIQKCVGVGCNLNRPIADLIGASGMEILELSRYLMPDTPRILGEMYRGVAGK